MELRQLQAFVAVATELHFGRAANRLGLSPPTVRELFRRLERDLGATLFARTTRSVSITPAGETLLVSARVILEEIAAARTAVSRIAGGEIGTVRVGVTPPAAVRLLPQLVARFASESPDVTVEQHRMWRPNLDAALAAEDIDVAILFGSAAPRDGIESRAFWSEPLFAGVRPDHRLASKQTVAMAELQDATLGITSADLFPAWTSYQRQALAAAGVAPRMVVLAGPDLDASRWAEQGEVDWILVIPSLAARHTTTVTLAIEPPYLVPFTLQWKVARADLPPVAQFVATALGSDVSGWSPGVAAGPAGRT